ncbi:MAG: hypothetical protein MI924_35940, partial [Chloroflexales bacterium]|nr:hypothetical protein [Chloroflexales bacterium]
MLRKGVGGDADHHEIERVRLSVDGLRRCQAGPRARRRRRRHVVIVDAERRKGTHQIAQRQQPKAQGEHAPYVSLQDQDHRFTSSGEQYPNPLAFIDICQCLNSAPMYSGKGVAARPNPRHTAPAPAVVLTVSAALSAALSASLARQTRDAGAPSRALHGIHGRTRTSPTWS